MRVRRALVRTAAALVIAVIVIAGIASLLLLKSNAGTSFVHARFESLLKRRVHGRVYLGKLSGDLLNRVQFDSLEIRDLDDSVMIASGPITASYDLSDFWDKRLVFHNVSVQRPYVHLRHDTLGIWNYKKVFAGDTTQRARGDTLRPTLPKLGRSWGDILLLDTVHVQNGRFRWTEPWTPSAYWTRAERDSVIAYNLARKDVDVRKVGKYYVKVRVWDILHAEFPLVRIKDPDKTGMEFTIGELDADEFDPPFRIRDMRGRVTMLKDTVRVAIDRFKLPGSSGSASGILLTRKGLGVRMRVIGDTVSMADIAWIYPTLPTTGGGRMTLDIRKDSSLDHIDYALSRMDVRTTQSQLVGKMTFGVGERILGLTDVDLALTPVNFKLIEQFNGGPLTLPWAGDLTGRVRGPGGPLNHFRVSDAVIDFADANVPGAVNRFSGMGELDIVRPINATFHDFAVDIAHFDLRTAQALNKLFPPWKGSIAGTARLDSIWTDLRLRDANFVYTAKPGVTSTFTGGGRVMTREKDMWYDLALVADPLVMEAIAVTYPDFPLKGTFRGPFTMRGAFDSLTVTGELEGEGARVQANLVIDDVYPRLGLNGTMTFAGVDPSRVFTNAAAYKGLLSMRVDANVSGDSLANMEGAARLTLLPSTLGDLRMRQGYAAAIFGNGVVRVDTLSLLSNAASLTGRGALGLRPDMRDSLRLDAVVDSLGALRPWLAPVSDTLPPDSLAGRVVTNAVLAGNIDTLNVRMNAVGTDVVYGTMKSVRVTGGADIADFWYKRTGTFAVNADTATLGGLKFDSTLVAGNFLGKDRARVTARMLSATGQAIDAGAMMTWDSLETRALLDSLQISIDEHIWKLARPAAITVTQNAWMVDSVDLRSGGEARVVLAATVPDSSNIAGRVVGTALPLEDLGKLFQTRIPLSGAGAIDLTLAGTRGSPVLSFDVRAAGATVAGARVDGLRLYGDYRDRSLTGQVDYVNRGKSVLHGNATIPVDLALHRVAKRMLERPLTGELHADSTDLAILESFTNKITTPTGRFDANLKLSGTWKNPDITGTAGITRGAMSFATLGGVRYHDITAQLRFLGDSLQIDTLSMRSGPEVDSFLEMNGFVSAADWSDPNFDLRVRARNFLAIDDPRVASLSITTDPAHALRAAGRKASSDLSGGLTINGKVFVPDSYRKNLIELDPEFLRTLDTTKAENRRLIPVAPPAFVEHMRANVDVNAGDDLWLRSAEANVQLGGGLKITAAPSVRASEHGRRVLALDGSLQAVRGTYRLNLGPVQRNFAVEPGGSVQFFGNDLNPTLNISALHTIRQFDQRDIQQDIHIRVLLTGTLAQPEVRLSSPDSIRISNADYVAYLLTGAPSLEIGRGAGSYVGGIVTSVGSLLSSRLTGGFFSEVEVSTAGLSNGYAGNVQTFSNILAGTRLGLGIPINDRFAGRLDLGLCQLGQLVGGTNFDFGGFANSAGFKVEYRFGSGYTASAGVDPSTTALFCAQNGNARGFVPKPRTFGLDMFRTWRF